MQTAYDTREQEDEHSCFSDNTHNDLLYNALSIENVYLGRYGGADGAGLDELVRARDPELDSRMQEQLKASVQAIHAIPRPFDQAIQGDGDDEGRARVSAAIEALRAQTRTIVDIAALLQIRLNLEE
jgi:putative iron-regulated protein